MIVLNQEARVPIYKWLRGVGFIDAGNVFARSAEASLRDLVGSVGIGLRLATPFALLRVDYAKAMWGIDTVTCAGSEPPLENIACAVRWTFGIGHAF